MIDWNSYTSAVDIKNAKEGNKDVFSAEEKGYFDDVQIVKTNDARKLAEILVAVKTAEKKNSKDEALTEKLDSERLKGDARGSLAWRVINSHSSRAQKALNRLRKLLVEREDVPTDKDARKTKRNELKAEKNKKSSQMGVNSDRQLFYRKQLIALENDKKTAQRNYARRKNFITILKGDPDGLIIDRNGNSVKLSSLSAIKTIKDYSNANVSKKDSDIGTGTGNEVNGDLSTLLGHAKTFFDSIITHNMPSPVYFESKSLETDFNGRRWNTKTNLMGAGGIGIGVSYLKVLKDIGIDNLNRAIDEVPGLDDSTKNKLKGYVKRIVESDLNFTKQITGKFKPNPEEIERNYNSWFSNLLKVGFDKYPHVHVQKWEEIFELMKVVFTPEFDASGKVIGLVDRNFYDSNHDSFLKPSNPKNGKKGWEDLTFSGYSAQPTEPRSDTYRAELKTPLTIPSEWDFKALTGLWWKIFAHHMNDPRSDTDHSWKPNYFSISDISVETNLDQLRYVKTMRTILKEFDVSDEIGAYDDLLLKYAAARERKHVIGSRTDILERGIGKWIGEQGKKFYLAIKEKKIYADDYDWETFADELFGLADDAESEVQRIESDIEQVRKQISQLSSDNAILQLEADSLQEDIDFLLSLDEEEEQPLDANKVTFQTLYDKKDDKWTRSELKRMQGILGIIKTKMSDDAAFDEEYKTKQDEISDIQEKIGKIDGELESSWSTFKRNSNDSVVEAIKKILKEKETIGTSLEEIKEGFDKLVELIKLDDSETAALEEIKKAIEKPDDYKDQPTSDLTVDKLNTIFHTTNITAGDIHESKWKSATEAGEYVTEEKVRKLIGDYYKGSTKPDETALKTHLEDTNFGITGDDYWEKFVKKGPKFIIGAIRHYEWEHGKGKWQGKAKDKEVTDSMTTANDEDKAKEWKLLIKEKWDTSKAADIAEFLYRRELNKTGKDLIKESKVIPQDTPTPRDDKETGFIAHLKRNWIAYTGGLIALVLLIGAAIWFWDDIKGMWGSSEDKDEENE